MINGTKVYGMACNEKDIPHNFDVRYITLLFGRIETAQRFSCHTKIRSN